MNNLRTRTALLFAGLSLSSTPALAGPHDFLIYAPGMGGSAAQAKPYLDTFLRYLEKQMAWPDHAASAEFVDDPKAISDQFDKAKPGFGLIPPSYYFELSCKKVPLSVVASVVGITNVSSSGKLHIVAKKDGGIKKLEDLKGKRLASNHLHDVRFVSRIVFEEKLEAEKFFVLQPTNSTVKPFKSVDRGEAEAALVDDAQLEHMKSLPAGQNLVVVWSSPSLPPYPVVAFDKVVKPAERDALKKAVLGMCSNKEGAEVCKQLQVTKFEPVDGKVFAAAAQRYCK